MQCVCLVAMLQELEEMRAQCTVLLREKFQLEQCVRYLAVHARLHNSSEMNATGTKERSITDRLLPSAMAQVRPVHCQARRMSCFLW